jgi:precorrin-3B synthase
MQTNVSGATVKSVESLTSSGKPVIKGWCPGVLRPMLSGDGLVVRIRPTSGRLSHPQATGIANLALRYGNGLIDLTNRSNLQLRGVSPSDLSELTDGLRCLDLLDASPDIEARRNIVVTPFWKAGDGTLCIAAALGKALSQADAPTLPSKFSFVVDTGEILVLHTTPANIRIERRAGLLFVYADGFACGAQVRLDQAVPMAMALAHWCAVNMTSQLDNPRKLFDVVEASLPEVFQLPLPLHVACLSVQIGANPHGWLVGIELGQMRAQTLMALAETASHFASGALRMTPWRMLLIEQLLDTNGLPELPGVITCADDPLLRVVACSGAPACLQAHIDTRSMARVLAPFVPLDTLLHISGCSKGCAHQKPTLTLVATATGIDMIRYGNVAAKPDVFAVASNTVLKELKRLLYATPI